MTAGELAVVLAAVLCTIGFAALVVVLVRVLDALRDLRGEVATLRAETGPLLTDLRTSTVEARGAVAEARDDLERFDRVLGSAEAISGAIGGGRLVRTALSAPVIKATALATGTSRAARRMRKQDAKRSGRRAARRDGGAAERAIDATGTAGPLRRTS